MKKLNWHNEKRIIDDLIPFEKNPRKISDKQKKELTESLKKFDLVEIPAIDLDNKIIAGHQRCKVLQLLGRGKEEVDVRVPNRKLTKEEFEEYNIRSNKNTAEFDFEMLADFDIGMLENIGFDSLELDEIFPPEIKPEDDEVPEIPKKPKSKLGDIYELPTGNGNFHRVMAGDSTKREDVEKLMNGVKADCVFTDPPWNVAIGMDSNPRHRQREGLINDNLGKNFFEFLEKLSKQIFEYNKGDTYCVMGCEEWPNIHKALTEVGLHWSSTIVWAKDIFVLGRSKYHRQYEPIWFGWKDKSSYKGDRKQSDLWQCKRPRVSKLHPTMKPVELVSKAITNSSKKDDIVLDLFLGSGSTLIACEKTNRICYGTELDCKYTDVIIQRYCDYTGNNEIIKNGKKITW